MRIASLFAAGVAAMFGLVSSIPAADAKARVVKFGKAGNWNVRAVYSSRGPFDHCSANARYKSGTRVSIIAYKSGNWRLWFAHKNWPNRQRSKFPATLTVDGRVVLRHTGNYKGRNAYVDLGRNVKRVRAIMRGRTMAIRTPNGSSRFSLNGTNRATRMIARCWKTHYKRSTGGAFGSANNKAPGGAFGGRRTANNKTGGAFGSGSKKFLELSRADTMEVATRYLAKATQPYAILPKNKSPLKYFPVNWRMRDGSVGGMRIFRNSRANVEKLLTSLLADQAKHCSGRNASEREKLRNVNGRQMIKARGVCQNSQGTTVRTQYRVAEIGNSLTMMIMEIRSAGNKGSRPKSSGKSSPSSNDGALRIPGPNEL